MIEPRVRLASDRPRRRLTQCLEVFSGLTPEHRPGFKVDRPIGLTGIKVAPLAAFTLDLPCPGRDTAQAPDPVPV